MIGFLLIVLTLLLMIYTGVTFFVYLGDKIRIKGDEHYVLTKDYLAKCFAVPMSELVESSTWINTYKIETPGLKASAYLTKLKQDIDKFGVSFSFESEFDSGFPSVGVTAYTVEQGTQKGIASNFVVYLLLLTWTIKRMISFRIYKRKGNGYKL